MESIVGILILICIHILFQKTVISGTSTFNRNCYVCHQVEHPNKLSQPYSYSSKSMWIIRGKIFIDRRKTLKRIAKNLKHWKGVVSRQLSLTQLLAHFFLVGWQRELKGQKWGKCVGWDNNSWIVKKKQKCCNNNNSKNLTWFYCSAWCYIIWYNDITLWPIVLAVSPPSFEGGEVEW